MGVKISALPATATPLMADQHPVNQAGTTKRQTNQQIYDLFLNELDSDAIMDANNRVLHHSSGLPAIDWENGWLFQDGDPFYSIDFTTRFLVDGFGQVKYSWQNGSNIIYADDANIAISVADRQLTDSTSSVVVDWETRIMNDTSGDLSIDWENRSLRDSSVSAFATISWDTGLMRDDGNVLSIDWFNRQASNGSSTLVIDWELNQLTDSAAVVAFDWELRTMTDTAGNLSQNFDLHMLYDAAGNPVFDYSLAKTGWGTPSGALARTTFATFGGQVISAVPTQAEVQAIDDHLVILSQRLGAVITDLKALKPFQA